MKTIQQPLQFVSNEKTFYYQKLTFIALFAKHNCFKHITNIEDKITLRLLINTR